MFKIKIIILVFLLFQFVGIGQTVTIKNYQTEKPINNVLVTNRSKTIKLYSDLNGKVSLNDFEIKELIYFSHQSFAKEKRTFS